VCPTGQLFLASIAVKRTCPAGKAAGSSSSFSCPAPAIRLDVRNGPTARVPRALRCLQARAQACIPAAKSTRGTRSACCAWCLEPWYGLPPFRSRQAWSLWTADDIEVQLRRAALCASPTQHGWYEDPDPPLAGRHRPKHLKIILSLGFHQVSNSTRAPTGPWPLPRSRC
jgi:hypothetical protein